MSKHAFDSVHWYMDEVMSRVVAKTGIPSDRHHLGKIILESLKDTPDFITQIDGATGETETNSSVLDRSVRCAVALRDQGFKHGDVMVLMAPNHIDLCIPQYAALYLGVKIAAIDAFLGIEELQHIFKVTQPNIIFCQSERTADVNEALLLLGLKSQLVTFDGDGCKSTFTELLKNVDDRAVESFTPADFDPATAVAYLTATSGTTGLPKAAILTHKNLVVSIPYVWLGFSKFPTPTRMTMVLSHLQWLTAIFHFVFAPVLKFTRLQTSAAVTVDHFTELINKYKPTFTTSSPNLMTTLTTAADRCDFTCFEGMLLGGSAVSEELISELKRLTKSDKVYSVWGLSEISGVGLMHESPPPPGSNGRLIGGLESRLVDHDRNVDVTEANAPGELWLRGPTVFQGYYNDPEVTAETLTEDGWLKTGDIFYRDQSWNFYFVERLKFLLKYRSHQISPEEVEAVIRRHPQVLDVAVTGIPDKEVGDLAVACVVPKPGTSPVAQEIKDLVKGTLTDSKQLRGGVIFMKEFPLTSTSKVHRQKLKQMVLTMERE